uniref:Ig-like domain-containing protein n=1 Tax=Taeniopygia guttata TaxID=59729 RepID=A0A674GMV8_TAEGU
MMWLLRTFFLATVFSCTCGSARDLQQIPISITKPEGKTVLINCHVSSPDFSNIFIHWYQKKANAAPKRFAYMFSSKSVCTLTVSKVKQQDSATYYCASWDPQYKVFGSGTKLIVSGKFSPPANSEILQKKHEDQIVYVCLIEKFYPEVIRVTWIKDGEEVTDNVVKGDTWQSTEEDEYSIASWLTVPAESEDKKYYCKYEHEEENILLETQVSETVLPLIAYRSKSL